MSMSLAFSGDKMLVPLWVFMLKMKAGGRTRRHTGTPWGPAYRDEVAGIPWSYDLRASYDWETQMGWEGVDVWHTKMNADPTITEGLAEDRFPLGMLLDGTDNPLGRRVQKVVVELGEKGSQADVLVHWFSLHIYSAT